VGTSKIKTKDEVSHEPGAAGDGEAKHESIAKHIAGSARFGRAQAGRAVASFEASA
jgi:hypothetical protein